MARFCVCDRSDSHLTMIPLGRCQICTALLTLFRFCPPGPLPRHACQSRSLSRSTTSVGLGSRRTATVTVLV